MTTYPPPELETRRTISFVRREEHALQSTSVQSVYVCLAHQRTFAPTSRPATETRRLANLASESEDDEFFKLVANAPHDAQSVVR